MSVEPLPLGFGDFSIAMAAEDASLASIWPPQLLPADDLQSVEELKHEMAAVTAELGATREEVCQKQHSIRSMVEHLLRTAHERDLLRELAIHMEDSATACPLLTSEPPPLELTPGRASATQADFPLTSSSVHQFAAVPVSADLDRSMAAAVAPQVLSFAAPLMSSSQVAVDHAPMIEPFGVPSSVVTINRGMDAAALEVPALVPDDRSKMVALELLAAKRALPQQGRLMKAVIEAGPLLEHLLVAGSLPRWRNPPPAQALTDAMISAPPGSGATMGSPWSPN